MPVEPSESFSDFSSQLSDSGILTDTTFRTLSTQFLQDHPDPELDDRHVVTSIRSVMREKKGELIFVSPYLIPSDGAIERIRTATESGIGGGGTTGEGYHRLLDLGEQVGLPADRDLGGDRRIAEREVGQ